MNISNRMLCLVTVVVIGVFCTLAFSEDCCDAVKEGEAHAATCALSDVAATTEACCLPAEVAKSVITPWQPATLGNATDPISGDSATREIYLDYVDTEGEVFARIYFASQASLEAARNGDLRELYEKTYLTRKDGTFASYGMTRLALNNTFCAVSGVGNSFGRKLALNESMATNCTAGSCSMGDGFKVNYNAVLIGACCPSCIKMLVADPEKFLSNLKPEIDAALETWRIAQEQEANG